MLKNVTFALIVLLLIGSYLMLMKTFSPLILKRDHDSSVWHLHNLANEKIRETAELKWIATLEERQQLLDDAVDILDRVREKRPDSDYFEYLWAVTKYNSVMFEKERNEAKVDMALERLIRMWEEGNRESNRLGRILVYHYVHEYPNPPLAKPILRRLLELDPSESQFYDNLSDLLISEKNFDEAIQVLEDKESQNLTTTGNRETLANLYFRVGQWKSVQSLLKVNLAGGATSPESWLLYGLALAIEGNQPSATQAFRSFLEGADGETPFQTSPLAEVDGYPVNAFPVFPYLLLESSLPTTETNP